MGVLSGWQIKRDRDLGSVVIEPFNPANVNTSSYDVTLGEWFFREQKPLNPEGDYQFYNIFSESEVARVWGSTPQQAEPAADWFRWHPHSDKRAGLVTEGINPDDRIIILPPGDTILAHTNEFIGGQHNRTTMMKARSSYGRNFIEVCKCAGYGDIGFFNRWTMEITNNSRYYHIPLVVGRRVAQIVFFTTGWVDESYTDEGKYQNAAPLKTLMEQWTPMQMLPRLHRDREISQ